MWPLERTHAKKLTPHDGHSTITIAHSEHFVLRRAKKGEMLVASIFSLSHYVFYHIKDRNHRFSDIYVVVCKSNHFGLLSLVDNFRLFIAATGCPSEHRPQKTVIRGIVQGYRRKQLRALPGSITFSAYSTVTRDLSLSSHPKDYCNFSRPAGDPNPQPPL